MIQADFYPTAIEATYGTLGDPDYEHFAFTDSLLDLDIDTTDIADPYLMGYMAYNQVPRMAQLSKVEFSSEEIIFKVVSDQNVNVPWFYTSGCTANYTTDAGTTGQSAYVNYNDGNGWALLGGRGTGDKYCRFINDINIQCINERILSVCFTYYFQYSSSMPWGYSYAWASQWITFSSTEEFMDFVNGDVTKTIVAGDTTIELNGTDFGSGQNAYPGTYTHQGETEDITIVVSITGFRIASSRDVSYGSGSGTSRGFSTLATGYKMKASEIDVDYIVSLGDYYESSFHPYGNENYSYLSVLRSDLAGGTLTFSGSNQPYCGFLLDSNAYVLGGFDMSIPMEFITTAVSGSPLTRGFNLLEAVGDPRNNNSTIRIYAIYPISQILQAAQQRTNITKGAVKYYGVTENAYYPKYNEDNSPAWELVNGEPEDVIPQLRDWQLGRIYDNDFTWEDIPPYVPPGPGPGPGGEPDEGDRGKPIPKYGNTPGMTDFVHYAAMTPTAINELAAQLWDKPDSFWEKIVAATSENPMDYFISLRYYPVSFNKAGGQSELYIGRGGQLHIANNYYPLFPVEQFNCGSITINRQYNNFLDYAPYTRIQIFLPFAGSFELNPTIVMGRTISLWLSVDVSDGSAVWEVYNETDHQPVLVKQCRMGAEIPLSGLDASQMAANVINASLGIAQHTLGAVSSTVSNKTSIATSAISGNLGGALNQSAGEAFSGPENILTGLTDAYNFARASKEIPQYSGGSSGAAACGINHTPYIVYRRPLCTNPDNFAHAVGYLSNKTALISGLSGFTICRNVDVGGISQATDKEKAQIKQILESGFYA